MAGTSPFPEAPSLSDIDAPERSGWLRDVTVAAGLSLIALLIRWPYLWAVPRFTDEILEVARGLAIARGRLLPLTNYDAYLGAIQNYMLAALFLLFGENPWTGRAMSFVLGGLTVGMTYLYGRDIARSVGALQPRVVGVLAALMLSVAGVHVVINSHVAWSNSMTPVFTTAGLWLVVRAVYLNRAWLLAPAGLIFGLALQTHWGAGMFLPAVAVYCIWKRPEFLRNRWLYIGAGLFLVGYSDVIAHNILNPGDTLRHGQFRRTRPNYLVDGPLPETDALAAARNIARATVMLGETLVSSLGERDNWPWPIDRALVTGGLLLSALSAVWSLRKGQALPLLSIVATLLILPILNPGRYTPITDGRYMSPLLPVCFASFVAMLFSVRITPGIWRALLAGLLLVFVVQPLGPLVRYELRTAEEVPSNQSLERSTQLINRFRVDANDEVVLDNRLNLGAFNVPSLREARAAYDGLSYLLPFYSFNILTTQVSRSSVDDRLRRRARLFVVLPPGYRSELQVGKVTPLRSDDAPVPSDPVSPNRPLYEIYLVERIDQPS